MNSNTIQKKMFNKLLSGDRIYYLENDDKEIGLTDGYVMYIIPKQELAISREKMSKAENLDVLSPNPDDCHITPTGNMKSFRGGVAVQYKCDKFVIWMNEKFLKEFNGCDFYASGPLSRVLAKTKFDEKVGVILPIRMKEEQ